MTAEEFRALRFESTLDRIASLEEAVNITVVESTPEGEKQTVEKMTRRWTIPPKEQRRGFRDEGLDPVPEYELFLDGNQEKWFKAAAPDYDGPQKHRYGHWNLFLRAVVDGCVDFSPEGLEIFIYWHSLGPALRRVENCPAYIDEQIRAWYDERKSYETGQFPGWV